MKNLFLKLQPFILTGVLVYGGLGNQNYYFLTGILLYFTLLLFYLVFSRENFQYPPGFYLYMLFLIFFAVNLFWTKNFWSTFWYLLIFTSGFFFWLFSYNFKEKFKNFDRLIVYVSLIFGLYSIVNLLNSPSEIHSYSLHKMATRDHHHIADLWSLTLIVIFIKVFLEKNKSILWFLLLAFGGYFMFIAKSRTALLSLISGIVYLLNGNHLIKKYRLFLMLTIFALGTLFLFLGRTKPTLMDRVYYLQGIAGVVHNPAGLGVGNFGLISGAPENHIFGLSDYSSVAMNILLEMFTGMGIFALVFLIWFIKIISSVLENTNNRDLIPRTVFLILTLNFMLDFTYLIPTMLWLWFISLGLSQKSTITR